MPLDPEIRAVLAETFGVVSAQRMLVEQLWAHLLMSDPNPLASCDLSAQHYREIKPVLGTHKNDPEFRYAVIQEFYAEIEATFARVRKLLEEEIEKRRGA